MSAVLWGALIALASGSAILPYLVIQAVVGFSLLEFVNYLEHYGMLRQKVGVGERSATSGSTPTHSWNCNNIATNVLPLPPAAAQRPPRQPDAALPVAARLPGVAGPADRLRRDDRARLVPAVWRRVMDQRVRRALRRRPDAGQPVPRKRGEVPDEVPAAGRARRQPIGDDVADASFDRRGAGGPVPRLRLRLRGRGGRRARGLRRPAPRGPTSPTTGAARTAASARRSTSCPSTPRRCDRRLMKIVADLREVRRPRHV